MGGFSFFLFSFGGSAVEQREHTGPGGEDVARLGAPVSADGVYFQSWGNITATGRRNLISCSSFVLIRPYQELRRGKALLNVSSTDVGLYSVRVRNGFGTVTSRSSA